MPTAAEAAGLLREIADLLDLAGERFKPEAYRRAARSVETLTEELQQVAARGELRTIPGVGEAIAEKLKEFLATGSIPYHTKLQAEFPPGLIALMHRPGMGPKTARRLWQELQIDGPEGLLAAIDAGRLQGLSGFQEKKIALLRAAVAAPAGPSAGRRWELQEAYQFARTIVEGLRASAPLERIEIAGSLRRRRETVGDLDILVTSDAPEKVFDAFSALPGVEAIQLRGGTKETITYRPGIQVDLRVVPPASFGAAWLYFTGSKDHNIRLRSIARDRSLKVNEYGIFRGEASIGGATEAEVYEALGLRWIPPEIREARGEIEAAEHDRLPTLVEESDLVGDLHLHLTAQTRRADLEALLVEARRRHWQYVGLVVPTDLDGLRPETKALLARLQKAPASRAPTVWLATEGERPSERTAGTLAPDFWVYAPRTPTPPPATSIDPTEAPLLLAHLATTGADGASDPVGLDRWLRWADGHGVAVDVTPRAGRDGIDSAAARRAREMELLVHLSSGATVEEGLSELAVSVGLARRGWIERASVLNSRDRATSVRKHALHDGVQGSSPTRLSPRDR